MIFKNKQSFRNRKAISAIKVNFRIRMELNNGLLIIESQEILHNYSKLKLNKTDR